MARANRSHHPSVNCETTSAVWQSLFARRLLLADWREAQARVAEAGIVGDLAPVEAAYSLKSLVEGLGGVVECRTDGARLPAGNRSGYVGNAAIEDIDGAKMILSAGLVVPEYEPGNPAQRSLPLPDEGAEKLSEKA